jgi:xanthine/CO dehydrogenase XdhC/CoxF family maturation factor
MLIEADGRITGLLSGGCLEQDLREHAAAILATERIRTVSYDMRADNDLIFGVGAGCEGSMEILLEPVRCGSRAACAIAMAAELSRQGEPVALVTVHDGRPEQCGTHLWRAHADSPCWAPLADACARAIEVARPQAFRSAEPSDRCAAWIQPVLPLPAIVICGAGPDAQPLAAALRALHYPVTVADHRPAYANSADFPGAAITLGTAATLAARIDLRRFFAAVIMSHHLGSDAEYLRALASTGVEYIGVLGPRTRRARLLAELGDVAATMEGRLRGPIGLDIGAVTPEGIALAIAAEIHAAASRRGEWLLRSVHDRLPPDQIRPASAV